MKDIFCELYDLFPNVHWSSSTSNSRKGALYCTLFLFWPNEEDPASDVATTCC